MPRFVRPAYMTLRADGVASDAGTGPRTKDGWLSATLTLRTADGLVSDPVGISAGGLRGVASIDIPASFAVDLETLPSGRTIVTLYPRRDGEE